MIATVPLRFSIPFKLEARINDRGDHAALGPGLEYKREHKGQTLELGV